MGISVQEDAGLLRVTVWAPAHREVWWFVRIEE